MWRHCSKRIRTAGEAAAHPWRWRPQLFAATHPINYLFRNTAASLSSFRKSADLENYYIRKRRKWPIKPYKTQPLLQTFVIKLAKQSFIQSVRKCKTHLLSDFIISFAAYEIEPTPQSYNFLVKFLIRTRPSNWNEQLQQVLGHLEKVENFGTTECMFVDVIKFYGDNNMLEDAVELFCRMPKYSCEPSVEVLNALLSALCRNDSGLKIVPEILLKTQEMNIRIDESSFRILIAALCDKGRASAALELLIYMNSEGYGVDQKVCSLALATMCRQLNCDGCESLGFLEGLKSLGFDPKHNDFRNIMRCLIRKGKCKNAMKLLKQMKLSGISPDITFYNLVINGLISSGDFLKVDKLFDELLVLGLVPDITTYNLYIYGLCMQKKVEDGIKMLCSMKELGCPPDLRTYCIISKALIQCGDSGRVRELVVEMQKKGINEFSSNGLEFVKQSVG